MTGRGREATEGFVYHFGHVFSDGLGSLHRVNGDSAGLLHAELTFETLLELLLSEVQFGVVVVCPLKHVNKNERDRQREVKTSYYCRTVRCFFALILAY